MNDSSPSPELGTFASPELARPIVVSLEDHDAVLLERAGDNQLEVWLNGTVSRYPATTPVIEVTDPERWQVAVRRALLNLNHQRGQAMQELADTKARHTATLDQIRSYAIDKHLIGAFDQADLNEFLAHVGLNLYDPHIYLTMETTGQFEIATSDVSAAQSLAAEALRYSGTNLVSGVDQNSITWHAEILDVTATSTDPSPRLELSYRLSGRVVVTGADVIRIRSDAETQVSPDLSAIPNLVPGSGRHETRIDFQFVD